MKNPAASSGVSKPVMGTIPIPSPPNVLVGGPDPDWPGFPLKACGNDGLRIGRCKDAASCGNEPQIIQNRAGKFETMLGETKNVMTGFPVKFSA